MRWKWKSSSSPPTRKVSDVVLDLVFGEPLPQPDVTEEDTDEAWQRWLDAVSDQEKIGLGKKDETGQFEMTTRLPLR